MQEALDYQSVAQKVFRQGFTVWFNFVRLLMCHCSLTVRHFYNHSDIVAKFCWISKHWGLQRSSIILQYITSSMGLEFLELKLPFSGVCENSITVLEILERYFCEFLYHFFLALQFFSISNSTCSSEPHGCPSRVASKRAGIPTPP